MVTMSELVKKYNEMAAEFATRSIPGNFKAVKKFRTLAEGTSRMEALEKVLTPPKSDTTREEKKKKEKRPRSEFTHPYGDVVEAFDFRVGSTREKLLNLLLDDFEGMVSAKSLGVLSKSIKGVSWRIESRGLPYELREKKESGVTSYGLYRKV